MLRRSSDTLKKAILEAALSNSLSKKANKKSNRFVFAAIYGDSKISKKDQVFQSLGADIIVKNVNDLLHLIGDYYALR